MSTIPVLSQVNETIPTDSWIYESVKILQIGGYFRVLDQGAQPYTRQEIAQQLVDIDDEMMAELTDLKESLDPVEILYVADGMTGQDAVNTAKAFNDRLDFEGVVLTKLDGDTRGGAALTIKSVVDKTKHYGWLPAQHFNNI